MYYVNNSPAAVDFILCSLGCLMTSLQKVGESKRKLITALQTAALFLERAAPCCYQDDHCAIV